MSKILVTGSSSGIGAEICRGLQAEGNHVIGLALANADVTADIGCSESRASAIEKIIKLSDGQLSGLVCSAGLGPSADPESIIAVNYFGTISILDALLPALESAKPSAAVILASTGATQLNLDENPLVEAMLTGDEPLAKSQAKAMGSGMFAYCASKYALIVGMRKRALDWSKSGVRLNGIAPGPIETPMLKALEEDSRLPDEARNFLPPIGRKGQANEIASLVKYLLSPDANFMHGSLIYMDGGINAVTRPKIF